MDSSYIKPSMEETFGEDGERLSVLLSKVPDLLDEMGGLLEGCMSARGTEWLQSILECTMRYFELPDAGIITLYNEDTGFDEVVASCIRDENVYMDIHLRSTDGSTSWCYANKKPRIWDSAYQTPDLDDEGQYSFRELLAEQQKPDFLNSSLLCCPLVTGDKVLGAIQLEHHDDGRHFTEFELHILASFISTPLASSLGRNGLYGTIWASIEHQSGLFRHMILGRENTQGAIARHLNERVTQTLAGVRLALGNLENFSAEEIGAEATRQYLFELRSDVDQALEAVGQLTSLYGGSYPAEGLVNSLESVLFGRVSNAGITPHLDADIDEDDLTEDVVETFFRVAQQAFQNVIQHSHASNVYVCLTQYDGVLTMTIDDDGCGFSNKQLVESGKACYGLQGMSARLFLIGGSSAVSSEIDAGTKVTAIAPVTAVME